MRLHRTHRRLQGYTGVIFELVITITPFTLVLDLHRVEHPGHHPQCAMHSPPAPSPQGSGGEGPAMTLITTGMVLALLIPIALLCRQCNAWERLAAFGSIGTKVAMLALVVAVMRGDRMLALVGALMISAGDAGMLLLARLLEEQKQ